MPTLTPNQRRQGSSGFRFPSRCNSNFSLTAETLGLYNSSLHWNLLSQTSKLTLKTKCFNARHPTAHVDSSPLLSDFKTLSLFYFLKTVRTTKLENKKVGLKITTVICSQTKFINGLACFSTGTHFCFLGRAQIFQKDTPQMKELLKIQHPRLT